jgi:DnaK suppressor protein
LSTSTQEAQVDTQAVRAQLLKRRDELRSRASRASSDLRHESDPLSADFAEQVTQRENDDVLGAISQSAREELRQLEAALRRLEEGRYATCSVCGEDIEEERLAAVPYTDRCRACAEGGKSPHRRWTS